MSWFSSQRSVRPLLASFAGGPILFCSVSRASDFASGVVQYNGGNLVGFDAPFNDPAAALGPMTDNTQFGALNPFNPPFNSPSPAPPATPTDPGQIVIVDPGGSITLKLASPIKTAGGSLGVFVNNGLFDVSSDGSGQADSSADTFSDYPGALVSVSNNPNTNTFVGLSSSTPSLATFSNPSNYWLDAPAYTGYDPLPGTVLADESKPFTGTGFDFANLTAPEIRTLLDGSAGGNWLSLSGVSLSEIQYVTFSVPANADYHMVIDAVNAVPEPGMGIVAAGGVGLLLARRRRLK